MFIKPIMVYCKWCQSIEQNGKIRKTVNSIFMLSIHYVWALSSLHQFKLHVLKTSFTVLVLHVGTSKVSMSGANVMNMLQTTQLDLLYFSFRWFSLNSFHYQYNDYYHFYGLLVCHIFEILSYTQCTHFFPMRMFFIK